MEENIQNFGLFLPYEPTSGQTGQFIEADLALDGIPKFPWVQKKYVSISHWIRN